jgi:hypothetical protein
MSRNEPGYRDAQLAIPRKTAGASAITCPDASVAPHRLTPNAAANPMVHLDVIG